MERNDDGHHHHHHRNHDVICYSKKIKKYSIKFLYIFIVIFLYKIDGSFALGKGRLMVPPSYTAYSHDLRVQLQLETIINNFNHQYSTNNSFSDLRLQLTRIDETARTIIGAIDIFLDIQSNVTQITIPCQYFLRGGIYELEIIENDNRNNKNIINNYNNSSLENLDERLKQQLDVRWPTPRLSVTPESIGTYPEEPLTAILEYPGNECILPSNFDQNENLPEFWLELLYCGHDIYCNSDNVTKSQILYKEQVRGFPKKRIVKLRCELFGLADHYIFQLKPDSTIPSSVSATAYIKADWSEQFLLNVLARNIFPCDPHSGIGVLFNYPECILDQADRIRLFGKLRADVISLAPPTTLHYVTEKRVIRGQHSLRFDCDFFSEKYIEYCFVYVSQAITNAVADVRMNCVPTLPLTDFENGGWGPWSEWTPCSTTCAGGTRNRYRFCDSPPPRYGANFCEGSAVETETCGGPIYGTWECIYGSGSGNLPADRPEVIAEIGPGCRCGCIIHLGVSKPRRLIASSSKSCPGRTFWLIQADDGYRIRFKFDFFRLPCNTQWLKIRDGDSLTSELIGNFLGGNGAAEYPKSIVSGNSQILVEFFSDELETTGQACGGGFLAHAQQIQGLQNMTLITSSKAIMPSVSIAPVAMNLTIAHIFVILFISIIIVISLLLGAQYVFRYRKYQLAESMGEPDSPAHTPCASLASFHENGRNDDHHPPSRAISTTTLISEVISLVKLRPRGHRVKHSRLRESIDIEQNEKTPGDNNCDEEDRKSHSDDDISINSTHTLTNEILNDLDNPKRQKKVLTSSISGNGSKTSGDGLVGGGEKGDGGLEEGDRSHSNGDDDDDLGVEIESSGVESISGSVSGGDYSPPSNKSISLPPTPNDTPIPLRKLRPKGNIVNNKKGKSDTKSVNGKSTRKGKIRDVSPVREEDTNENDINILQIGMADRRIKVLSASNVTLTNVRGSYSPASSMISTATIRTTNQKESKEKQNREKLLAGPGSEFSLANPEDLELDYYDYNVINAGAAPGSYLGMDPAYLVWIPPIDEGNIINEVENDEPHYEEILPRHLNLDPGSNTESPDDEIIPELPALNNKKTNSENKKNLLNNRNNIAAQTILTDISSLNSHENLTKLDYKYNSNKKLSNYDIKDGKTNNNINSSDIQLHDFTNSKNLLNKKLCSSSSSSAASVVPSQTKNTTTISTSSPVTLTTNLSSTKFHLKDNSDVEKETSVIKSPSDVNEYYDIDDIQFADDDDDDDCDDDFEVENIFLSNKTKNQNNGQSSNPNVYHVKT